MPAHNGGSLADELGLPHLEEVRQVFRELDEVSIEDQVSLVLAVGVFREEARHRRF